MKRNTQFLMLFALVLSLFSACKKDDFKEEEAFVKIYNEMDGNKKFFPLGIQQTNDAGFLILSAYNGWNIHLMKTDAKGEIIWKLDVPEPYVSATPNLLLHNGKYVFVCMDDVGLFTYVMEVDAQHGTISEIQKYTSLLYPTFAYSNGSNVYVQNYDRNSNETGIHKLSNAMTSIETSGASSVLTSVESQIVDHITYNGRRFPFLIATTTDDAHVAMSGFYNYSFSLVFLDQNLNQTGVYNGAAYTGGINALLPLDNGNFALGKFSNEFQYISPSVSLSPSTIDITNNISAQAMAELDPKKPVVLKELGVNGTSSYCFIGSTKSNNLLMSIYDKASGNLLGTKYIGKNTPYTICDAIPTSDGGLMLLVQVKVMGNYNRIATLKFSDEQLKEAIGVE